MSVFTEVSHTMRKNDIAIVTMVYNEPDFVPVWTKYYGDQIGLENCFILDHGSDDGTIFSKSVNVIDIPRSPFDENWRANLVSTFCNSLLENYHCVAYTDVDEILVADPRKYTGLKDLCLNIDTDVLTSFGMDIVHVQENEAEINLQKLITDQRRWVRPFWSLCKPSLTKRSIKWGPGFHYADTATTFGDLFLFHLAYADFGIIERRQRKRASVQRIAGSGDHHGINPSDMVAHIARDYSALPKIYNVQMDHDCLARNDFVKELFEKGREAFGGLIIGSGPQSKNLLEIPSRFSGIF